jgi:hypothetical protein
MSDSLTLQWAYFFWRLEKAPHAPQLDWPLGSHANTLNQPFLSSKPLSLSQASLKSKFHKRDLSHSLE